ncbi:hypothetical protein KO488_00315 [Poseidonibacter lekithochrous]|uniref:hypothetical protein n=1 Tax=Poseidonibacter TaxID=2321187 RepID=UPI001C09F4CC|nr:MULTISPECIES: hypothetical protein [Poseidonibacter]MBU3013183.1 hypothetical protein [Poseidonibacter lekithochrous]MDO6826479.1 hypothetical protein [Poseidonibacter sp. 1_MG-2023]
METSYSKKNHLEINNSVLFKSSEFKESVMKESAEKFVLISQTTRYMPEIVHKGDSMNIVSYFDKMKELYFQKSSIENIFNQWEEEPSRLVSFLTPLYHMGYFLLLADVSNNKDLKNKLKNRASSFLRTYYKLEEYQAIIANNDVPNVNIKSLDFKGLIAQWMSFINLFLSDFTIYLIKSNQKVTLQNKDEIELNFKNLMKDIKPKSFNINEEILTYLK